MVVFVIDSCEGLIANDKHTFKQLIQLVINEVNNCNIILTTTMRIKDSHEVLIVIDGLQKQHALNLFLKHADRVIEIKEQEALLKCKPDEKKYPMQKFEKIEKYYDHHLFKLIGGNPQSILLLAPMLRDPYKSLTIIDLYKILTSNEMNDLLKSENIDCKDNNMTASMRISVEAAFKNISDTDKEALDLFFILSMFPGGLLVQDLDQIWAKLK